ncbi:hypothetical protein [Thalassotalea sp. PLHSN55]|uniref:hypothetical protein n=1 Tax=Thalassotalea sp. PLHSN55 TaxID=3435888 RepID=UPI003F87C235
MKLFLPVLSLLLVACQSTSSATPEEKFVDVYISKGDKQCHFGGISLAKAKGYLLEENISVSQASCAVITGMAYPSVCGGATGNIYLFTIDAAKLNAAKAIGFIPAAALTTKKLGYQVQKCQKVINNKNM